MQKFSRFTWPILAELILNFVVGIVLYRMLGRIADSASGAVGAVGSLFSLFSMFFLGLSQAGGILIANSLGRMDKGLAARQRGLLLTVFILAGAGVIMLVHFCRIPLLTSILGLKGQTLEHAALYCRIAQWTLGFHALLHFMTALYRSMGNSVLPMLTAFVNNLVVLTFLWLVPRLSPFYSVSGVEWAAACQLGGTLCAFIVSSCIFKFHVREAIELPSRGYFVKQELKALLKLALAVVLEPVAYSLSQVVVSRFFAELGDSALAAKAYAVTFSAVPSLIGIAMGWGAQIQVSYLLGAEKHKEAQEVVLRNCRIAVLTAPLMSFIVFMFSDYFLPYFSTDASVVSSARILLGCFFLLEIGRSCNTTIAPALKARGDAGYVARTAFISMLFLMLPFAWFLAFYLATGILGLGLALASDELLRGYLNLTRWKKS